MKPINSYEDEKFAQAYSELKFSGTYYLAYRDLPKIIFEHIKGKKAIDFGCGTGRSTRFLKNYGFDTIGIDISKDMIKIAKEKDPKGNYFLIKDQDVSRFKENTYDLIIAAFTFDNISEVNNKIGILRQIRELLNYTGKIIIIVSAPEIYINEWASFSTKDFPDNKNAKTGDKVKIIITDIDDKTPVIDTVCTDEAYQDIFDKAGLKLVKIYKPLAKENEPYEWINETKIAPWIIYVLSKIY